MEIAEKQSCCRIRAGGRGTSMPVIRSRAEFIGETSRLFAGSELLRDLQKCRANLVKPEALCSPKVELVPVTNLLRDQRIKRQENPALLFLRPTFLPPL